MTYCKAGKFGGKKVWREESLAGRKFGEFGKS